MPLGWKWKCRGPSPGGSETAGGSFGGQCALLLVELPDEDPVQPQIHVQYEAPGGVGLDHVCMGPVVPAEGETAQRGVGRSGRADLAGVVLDVGGLAQTAAFEDWQHRDRSPEIVGDQHEPPGWVEAHEGGAGSAGSDGVEQFEFPVRSVDGEGADGTLLRFAEAIRFVGGIEARAGSVQSQATWARAHRVDTGGRHHPVSAVHPEEVDAPAVAGRQVHLGRQHVAERGTEGPDIGDERAARLLPPGASHPPRARPRPARRRFSGRNVENRLVISWGEHPVSSGVVSGYLTHRIRRDKASDRS